MLLNKWNTVCIIAYICCTIFFWVIVKCSTWIDKEKLVMCNSVSAEKLFHFFLFAESFSKCNDLHVCVINRKSKYFVDYVTAKNTCSKVLFLRSFCWVTESRSKVLVNTKGRIRNKFSVVDRTQCKLCCPLHFMLKWTTRQLLINKSILFSL